MDLNLEALETSFDRLAGRGNELVDVFYFRLFARAPEVVRVLLRADPKFVKAMLLGGLATLRHSLPTLGSSAPGFRALGARLHQQGLEPRHYPVIGEVLIASMADVLGEAWLPEFDDAWSDVFVAVGCAMVDCAENHILPAAA